MMKIAIKLTVEIDPEKWAEVNGQIVDADGSFTTKDLREDVRSYFLNLVQCSTMLEEADGSASLS